MKSKGSLLLVAAGVVVVGSIVAAVVVLGGPAAERQRNLDDRRASDLQALSMWTEMYYKAHKQMPGKLEDIARERPGISLSTQDPATGVAYEYRELSGRQYELCATFARASGEGRPLPAANAWAHAAGRQCFTMEVKESTIAENPSDPLNPDRRVVAPRGR